MQNRIYTFKPSLLYSSILTVLLLVSCFAVCLADISGWVKGLLIICAFIYTMHALYKYGMLKHKHAITGLRPLSNGSWEILRREGYLVGSLQGDSTVTRWLIILRFKPINHRGVVSCLILPDSLSQEAFQAMLVQLRLITLGVPLH